MVARGASQREELNRGPHTHPARYALFQVRAAIDPHTWQTHLPIEIRVAVDAARVTLQERASAPANRFTRATSSRSRSRRSWREAFHSTSSARCCSKWRDGRSGCPARTGSDAAEGWRFDREGAAAHRPGVIEVGDEEGAEEACAQRAAADRR